MSRAPESPSHVDSIRVERRRFCGWLLAPAAQTLLTALWARDAQAAQILAARLWPAQEYTRLTLESKEAITYTLSQVKNPERLVLDLEGVELTSDLQQFATRVAPDDPYIHAIRFGKFKPGVLRLVVDLKTEINPQIFALKPVAEYGYRLVVDLYPLQAVDPLMALLEQDKREEQSKAVEKASEKSKTVEESPRKTAKADDIKRMITVVIDPGHGGENPRAHRARGTPGKK